MRSTPMRSCPARRRIERGSCRTIWSLASERNMKLLLIAAATALLFCSLGGTARAADVDCISTTFNLLSPNDKVCVSAFEDPQVSNVVCHISQARKGGWGQPFGLNEDPSN